MARGFRGSDHFGRLTAFELLKPISVTIQAQCTVSYLPDLERRDRKASWKKFMRNRLHDISDVGQSISLLEIFTINIGRCNFDAFPRCRLFVLPVVAEIRFFDSRVGGLYLGIGEISVYLTTLIQVLKLVDLVWHQNGLLIRHLLVDLLRRWITRDNMGLLWRYKPLLNCYTLRVVAIRCLTGCSFSVFILLSRF